MKPNNPIPGLELTEAQLKRRDEVLGRVIDFVRRDEKIRLPAFDPANTEPGQDYALQRLEDNDFSGTAGDYGYQIEGEDDLLHLIVVRRNGQPLTPEAARSVAGFVFEGVSPAVIWLKPGEFSQHFYLGHDELLIP